MTWICQVKLWLQVIWASWVPEVKGWVAASSWSVDVAIWYPALETVSICWHLIGVSLACQGMCCQLSKSQTLSLTFQSKPFAPLWHLDADGTISRFWVLNKNGHPKLQVSQNIHNGVCVPHGMRILLGTIKCSVCLQHCIKHRVFFLQWEISAVLLLMRFPEHRHAWCRVATGAKNASYS